jgi:hypothetical protein
MLAAGQAKGANREVHAYAGDGESVGFVFEEPEDGVGEFGFESGPGVEGEGRSRIPADH